MPEEKFEVNKNLQLGEQTTVKPEPKPVQVEIDERTAKYDKCISIIDKVIKALEEAQGELPEEAGTSRAIPSLKSNLNYTEGQFKYLKTELQK